MLCSVFRSEVLGSVFRSEMLGSVFSGYHLATLLVWWSVRMCFFSIAVCHVYQGHRCVCVCVLGGLTSRLRLNVSTPTKRGKCLFIHTQTHTDAEVLSISFPFLNHFT